MTVPPEDAGAPPEPEGAPRRRRGCLARLLIASGVAVAVVVFVASGAIWWVRSHQDVHLPDDGPLPTSVPRRSQRSAAMITRTFLQQGVNRREVVYVLPPDRAADERLPTVVFLHGVSTSPGFMQQNIGLNQAVVDRRFIAVVPHGIAQSWNAGRCCRPAMTLGIDDVAFLDAVVRDARSRPEVDQNRVYLVGESNGGIMTYRYLCDHAARVAGAASVLGTNQTGCTPSTALPLLHIAATADEVIPYDGGFPLGSRIASGGGFPPVRATMDDIAREFGCDPQPVTEPTGSVERTEWSGCRDGVPLRLDSVLGGRHVWPKGDDYHATEVVLDFFGITPA